MSSYHLWSKTKNHREKETRRAKTPSIEPATSTSPAVGELENSFVDRWVAGQTHRGRPSGAWSVRAYRQLVVLLLILVVSPGGPAAARGDGITGEPQPYQVFLPAIRSESRTWFDLAELEAAQRALGFDVAVVAEHTVCALDASAQPPVLIRYEHCVQYWHDGHTTIDGGVVIYFWFNGERVAWLLMSSISEG